MQDLSDTIQGNESNQGFYLSGVYQMSSQWSLGTRYGEFNGFEAHGDHYHEQKINETDLMIAWNHSHFSTVRLQYTHQTDGTGASDGIVTLQYVMSLGAHDAHTF